jgi:D-cysteine desulfhydrase
VSVELPRRWPLGVLPTPLVAAERLGRALGIELWVKRDDLIGFVHAGNKTRPLELIIEDAVRGGHDHVVGCGSPSSNFCAGLAAAAATAGVQCTLVLSGDPPDAEPPAFNAAAARAWGASIIHTGDPDRSTVEPAAARVADELASEGHRPYVVPRGGATPLGAAGFAIAAIELAGQAAAGRPPPERIVIAAGSGASAAGLLAGLAHLGWDTTIAAASVSRPPDEIADRIVTLARGCAERLATAAPDPDRLDVHDAIGPGFGIADPAGDVAAEVARRTEGLLLDATYTAKAAALLMHLARDAPVPTVFWHTGGIARALRDSTEGANRVP